MSRVAARLAFVALAFASGAHAAHPLISDDPGTQGTGGWEIENGFSAARGNPTAGDTSELGIQVSYGLLPTLDLIVRPRYQTQQPPGEERVRGFGDTALDFKWRFYDRDDVQLAIRAGADLTTGDESKGLGNPHTGWHGLIAVSFPIGPGSLIANVGYVRARVPGQQTHQEFVSAAWLAPSEGAVRGFIEAAAQSNSDPTIKTWPAVARTGVLWHLTDKIDADVGIEGRLNRQAPSVTLLAGVTLHF